MAILPSIDNNTRKRELTEKQQSFLNHLVDTNGDAKKAAEHREAAAARRMWLSEAQKGLADFTTA